MEPITTAIAAAALAGAAPGITKVVEQGIVDAYNGLKAIIQKKYGENSKVSQAVEAVAEEPDFEPNQATLDARVQQAGVDQDPEVAQAVQQLLDELKKRPERVAATGVNMEQVEAASIRIKEVLSSGTGVNMKGVKASGDIEIGSVRAGVDTDPKV